MKARQYIPDWLKGIAIILVVYGHIDHIGNLAILQKFDTGIIYSFHIPLFLMISGFFFNPFRDPQAMILKVLNRLGKPYVIFISLYFLGLYIISLIGIHTSNLPPNSLSAVLSGIFLKPWGAYWFLHSLILIQLCISISLYIINRLKLISSLSLILAIIFLSLISSSNLIDLSEKTIVYFLVGMVLQQLDRTLPSSLGIGAILLLILLLTRWDQIFVSPSLTAFSLVELGWCLSILMFLSGLGKVLQENRLFYRIAWIGRNSLVILVLHAIFINAAKPLSSLVLKVDPTGLLYSFVVTFVVVCSCLWVSVIIDKLRITPLLFSVEKIYSPYKFEIALADYDRLSSKEYP
jgi:fucose 4-O-acetylase-like acetyltransferase